MSEQHTSLVPLHTPTTLRSHTRTPTPTRNRMYVCMYVCVCICNVCVYVCMYVCVCRHSYKEREGAISLSDIWDQSLAETELTGLR